MFKWGMWPMKLHRFLEDYAHFIELNANDTFGWACAETVTIEIDELPGVIELEKLFGYHGVNAFMSEKTDQDVLKQLQSEEYNKAKLYIKENFIKGSHNILPKKYVWQEPYEEKGFVIFNSNGNTLDYCEKE